MLLRPYQIAMLKESDALMRQGIRKQIFQLPTGAGKTALAVDIIKRATKRGKRVWFGVHRRQLLEQTREVFLEEKIPYGMIAADYFYDYGPKCQIFSVGTLTRRLKKLHGLPHPDIIIIDECHHVAAKSYSRICDFYSNASLIGLTATPSRLDGKPLSPWFDTIIKGPTPQELIKQGYLCDYKLYSFDENIATSSIARSGGDFNQHDLTEMMDKKSYIIGNAIKHYKKYCMGKRAIVNCYSVAHSKRTANEFCKAGIRAIHIDSTTDKNTRSSAISKLKDGSVLALCHVDILSEGVDIPMAEVCILLLPTLSLTRYLQRVGRVLRPHHGKDIAIILDHVGNAVSISDGGQGHGLPCQDREWTLEGVSKKQKEEQEKAWQTKYCPNCKCLNKKSARVCANTKHRKVDGKWIPCGHVFNEIKEKTIENKKGELKLINKDILRASFDARIKACDSLKEAERVCKEFVAKKPNYIKKNGKWIINIL